MKRFLWVSLAIVTGAALLLWVLGVHRLFFAPSAPLHEAAFSGDLEAIARLLDRDPSAKNELATFFVDPRRSTITPLMWAVEGGKAQSVRTLLDRGADVNITDRLGRTALHLAAGAGDAAIVRQLVDAGADISRRTPAHGSPLEIAVRGSHDEVVALLMREGADIEDRRSSARFAAADFGSARSMQLLLDSEPAPSREELEKLLRRAETRAARDGAEVADVIRSHLQ